MNDIMKDEGEGENENERDEAKVRDKSLRRVMRQKNILSDQRRGIRQAKARVSTASLVCCRGLRMPGILERRRLKMKKGKSKSQTG